MFIQISLLLVRLGFYLLVLFQTCIFLIPQCKPALQKLDTFVHLLNPTVHTILELLQYYTTNKIFVFLSLDCSVPLRVCNQNILIKITCINSFLLSVCLSIWHIILFLFVFNYRVSPLLVDLTFFSRFFFFWWGLFLKSWLNLLQCCFCFMFCFAFFGHEGMGS